MNAGRVERERSVEGNPNEAPFSSVIIGHGVRNEEQPILACDDHSGDHIQRDIIHTKSPDKILDVGNMFLMWLGGKKGFKKPTAIVDLTDLAHLGER